MQIDIIRQRTRALGARPLHEQRVVRDWVQCAPHDQGRRCPVDFLPSTVGDVRAFERLAAGPVTPALALSLHTTKAALRERLLPRASRLTPRELVDHAGRYARLTGYPVQFQWTLLEGVNDGEDEMDGIVELLKGKHAVLNMIPYNTIPDLELKRPSWERARALAAALHQRGVLTKLRDSAGQDVDGGCGQLRARAAAPRNIPIRRA